jgi:hypothetical protein
MKAEWRLLNEYSGALAAEARGARLMIDASLEHRARWLLKLQPVSEAELEYLATGRLAPETAAAASSGRPRWPKVVVVAVLLLAALLAVLQIAGTVGIGYR